MVMYQVTVHRRAKKFLTAIARKDTHVIIEKIELLSRDPFASALDIKKLATTRQSYRLRISSIRVVYEIDTKAKKIFIQDIGFRGSIY